jgi:hypothetical protein
MASSHMIIGHLCVFVIETSIQILAHFLIALVIFLLLISNIS